jgi:ribosomal protein RSM22 (predicted rRNA methylase)
MRKCLHLLYSPYMLHTFLNIPENITASISGVFASQENSNWVARAQKLHERYMLSKKGKENKYLQDYTDLLAYIALRSPATYAQITAALLQVQEVMPHFTPKTVLDMGSGPGTGVWAAQTVWRSLVMATCTDQEASFLSINRSIVEGAKLPLKVSWQSADVSNLAENFNTMYDVVIIANVLNEIDETGRINVVTKAFNLCRGVMIIIEPGTPFGSIIVSDIAKHFGKRAALVAPYMNNSFVSDQNYYIHFPQRFLRPEFTRRVRQHMREDHLSSSNVEEAKYSFVAISKIPQEVAAWGRCVGNIEKQKGFLEVPVLTESGIAKVKVLKRNKQQYEFAKNLRWGEIITSKDSLI